MTCGPDLDERLQDSDWCAWLLLRDDRRYLRMMQARPIDKSFIGGISGDGTSDLRIVETILTLAHSLGIEVVAEGVESTEQLEMLRDLGCDFVQGYRFAKPVHPEVAEAILHAEPVW